MAHFDIKMLKTIFIIIIYLRCFNRDFLLLSIINSKKLLAAAFYTVLFLFVCRRPQLDNSLLLYSW